MLKPLEKEEIVREILSKRFNTSFFKKKVFLKNKKKYHEFDLVSQDGSILGEVKSDKHTKKGYPSTRFPRAMLACRYLELAKAQKRLMIFTDKDFYENFKRDSAGMLMKNIEIMFIDISQNGKLT